MRFVLMNSAGVRNRDLDERRTTAERAVNTLLHVLLPPHADNEAAADYLRTTFGRDNAAIEWSAVRPDSLINEETVTPYDVYASPIRGPLFNAGKTSRINVAHFMAELMTSDEPWARWKGQMPVIYNKPA